MFKKLFFLFNTIFLFIPTALWAGDFGLTEAANETGLKGGSTDITKIVADFVNVALSMVGVIFLILFIYGGFKWMLSRGDSKEIEEAQGILKAAVIGLVIIFSAYALTNFVVNNLGATLN